MLAGLAGGVLGVMALSTTLVVVLGTSKSAEATVVDSVQNTLAGRTAHVDLTLSGTAGGVPVTGSGSGVMDFGQNAAQLHIDVQAAGQHVGLDEIVVGKVVYVGSGIAGASLGQLFPGKSWISVDLSSVPSSEGSSATSFGSNTNPAAMLRLLAERGNTVVPLGSSTVGGAAVQGYSVTFDPAKISAELQSPNLPSWLRQATNQVDFGHLVMRVYIDGTGLLRRWAMDTTVTAAGTPASITETLDFSDYGAGVQVTAPPATEVLPLEQLLQSAGSASGR